MSSATRVGAAALIGLCLLGAPPARAAEPDAAIGLWSYRTSFPTGLAGELILTRKAARWHATLAGASAEATAVGRDVRLAFPGEGGAFRGVLDRGQLRGFWIRRAVPEDPSFPAGASQPYASPLRLRAAGPGRWRATVAPLPDTFTLYLKVFRYADGQLKAALRNPELNAHGPAMQFAAAQDGDALRLTPPEAAKAPPLEAKVLHGPDRISIYSSELKRNIELTRAGPGDVAHFFPRPQPAKPYVYRRPDMNGDGWQVARARDVGMNETALAHAVQRVIDVDPAGARPWLIHSMAVARHGKLVLDEYFYGYGRDEPHDTRSASKTFAAVILGQLMLHGSSLSPATRVYEAMAPRGPFANPDPRKSRITLGHLMTHSAGLACDDNAGNSPGDEDKMESDLSHPDWTKVTLDLPMQFEPGAHYAYCSMNINLAGAVLAQSVGEWLPALFDRTVARPLQFGPYYWNLQGSGEGYLGGGVFVRTRDFLKIGQAYLDGGVWNRRRIAGAAWTKAAVAPHMHISPETTGVSGDAFRENYYDTYDGWTWHRLDIKWEGRAYPAFHANGNGGQLLIVVPQFDLVVMFTAGNYGQGLWNRERDDIVGGMIIPAIRDAAG